MTLVITENNPVVPGCQLLKCKLNFFIFSGLTSRGRPKYETDGVIKITKRFYDAMQEILWLGYVCVGMDENSGRYIERDKKMRLGWEKEREAGK